MSKEILDFIAVWGFVISIIGFVITIILLAFNLFLIRGQLKVAKTQNETQIEIAKEQFKTQRDIAERQFRIEVRSRNRQEWINVLRNNVAELVSLITPIVVFDPDHANNQSWEKYDEAWRKAEYSAAKIELMLNVEKPLQKPVSDLVNDLRVAMIDIHLIDIDEKRNKKDRKQVEDRIDNLVEELFPAMQVLLKSVWERVKRGE